MEVQREQIILRITDTGPGIPPADQTHIFEKFYRASNVPKGVGGSGLGLAIVKSIVDSHHGRIWVELSLGRGQHLRSSCRSPKRASFDLYKNLSRWGGTASRPTFESGLLNAASAEWSNSAEAFAKGGDWRICHVFFSTCLRCKS